jgi:hypothetical protein
MTPDATLIDIYANAIRVKVESREYDKLKFSAGD